MAGMGGAFRSALESTPSHSTQQWNGHLCREEKLLDIYAFSAVKEYVLDFDWCPVSVI